MFLIPAFISAQAFAACTYDPYSLVSFSALLLSLYKHSSEAFNYSSFFLSSNSSMISLSNSSFSAAYSYLASLAIASTAILATCYSSFSFLVSPFLLSDDAAATASYYSNSTSPFLILAISISGSGATLSLV